MILALTLFGCSPSSESPVSAPISLRRTRWGESHELLVTLDAPRAGQSFAYRAHLTRLSDHSPPPEGSLTLRFEQDGFAIESHTDGEPSRAGLFARHAMAPSSPGDYQLFVSFSDGSSQTEWDAGTVTVGGDAPHRHPDEPAGEITFRKDAQWQVPFAVTPAARHPLTPAVEAAAVVEPAPTSTAVVAAPVDGLLAWEDSLPVVGRTVQRGERLATLIPAGAAEHWVQLQAAVTTARIDRDLAAADRDRIAGLPEGAQLSERRQDEVEAALARAQATLSAAQRQVAALTSSKAGAVPIHAPADGVIVTAGAGHGAPVHAGTPLIRVSAGSGLLLTGRVTARTHAALSPLATLTVQRGDWDAPRDVLAAGGALVTEQLIFDPATLSAPVAAQLPDPIGLRPGDLVTLSIGVGSAEPILAVPREAVVEVMGRDVVFVQQSAETFSRRPVTLGPADATHVAVLDGLAEGERVVVRGGFDVHVASLSGALESHRH